MSTKPSTFYFPTIGTKVDDNPVLFPIDGGLFPLRKNLCVYYSKPNVHGQPVIRPSDNPDAPDSLASHFYGTVLYDEGKYRMWYLGMTVDYNPDLEAEELAEAKKRYSEIAMGPICYAESDDGINWVKPNLGKLKYKGSSNNNAIYLPDAIVHCPTIIKDEEDPDPQRRYKMVYQYFLHTEPTNHWGTMRTATSPNGIDWTVGPRNPILEFVEHASFYKYRGVYMINGHKNSHWNRGEGGSLGGRQGYVYMSTDFENWLEETAESFTLPEPLEREKRGVEKEYTQVHLGTAPILYSTTAVGLYCIWYNHEEFGKISGDFGLVISNDGVRFHEPIKEFVYMSTEDSPIAPDVKKSYTVVLCQANGIINVGDETLIYHGRWLNSGTEAQKEYAEIALATLPRDRWGAVGLYPNETKGSLWSVPLVWPDEDFDIILNADGAQGMRVEISDERFQLHPQFAHASSGYVETANGLDCVVKWNHASLRQLAGETVRIRIHLEKTDDQDPKLYAVYLKKR
ncbi:hypothetical protein [Paenibacillus eucommiae]|uniref:Glycosyl hydrolase family 32 N-terminal domain-containing protein n=1 Tax=Paenibacillus eucommiae TaxID=1355755 RepID=A0ABS4IRC2_9BACL|nr:hypothetical protein [Paenibacillus eucommiae]MBP1990112.1 hypothetical protein [Paenibacillus eucommiae]